MEIESTTFGTITIDGKTHEHDVVIRLSGEIVKRKKKLSKKYYGTSHVVSKDEAKFVFERGCEQFIVGSGQMGNVHLSPEAEAYFAKKESTLSSMAWPHLALSSVIGSVLFLCGGRHSRWAHRRPRIVEPRGNDLAGCLPRQKTHQACKGKGCASRPQRWHCLGRVGDHGLSNCRGVRHRSSLSLREVPSLRHHFREVMIVLGLTAAHGRRTVARPI